MFYGEYKHNLDTKGRLSIPAKFRGECGDHVYIMRGHEGCLDIYTEEGWQAYYEELKKLSNKKKEERAYLRMVTSRMNCSEFDKLGRINIPQVLRTHAHLEKECTIVGAGEQVLEIDPKSTLLINGDTGTFVLDPDAAQIEQAKQEREQHASYKTQCVFHAFVCLM